MVTDAHSKEELDALKATRDKTPEKPKRGRKAANTDD
jgi:hypothetical protein